MVHATNAIVLAALVAVAEAFSGGGGNEGSGQSCDALNLCMAGGKCPAGMDKVCSEEHTCGGYGAMRFSRSPRLFAPSPPAPKR